MFNCVGELFVECVCYLCGWSECFSLKVMVLFWVVLAFCWLVRVLSSKEYVCCVCDPSVCLGVPSTCQICVFVWGMWFQSLTLRLIDHLRVVLWCCLCVLFCVLCVHYGLKYCVVCMWCVSCLLGCCVCLRGEWCLWTWCLQCVRLVVVECQCL